MPHSSPETAPKTSGRPRRNSAAPSTHSASTTYSGSAGVVWPNTGPTSRLISPRTARNIAAAAIAPPRPIHSRAVTSANPAARAISSGWKMKRNCGTPKSNSPWKVDRPMSSPPIMPTRRTAVIRGRSRVPPPLSRRAARRARMPSCSSTAWPISVIEAPPKSIRCVGPQSVTSWPKSRCHMSSSGKPISAKAPHAAMSTPPTGAYQSRWMRMAPAPGRSLGRAMARQPDANTP